MRAHLNNFALPSWNHKLPQLVRKGQLSHTAATVPYSVKWQIAEVHRYRIVLDGGRGASVQSNHPGRIWMFKHDEVHFIVLNNTATRVSVATKARRWLMMLNSNVLGWLKCSSFINWTPLLGTHSNEPRASLSYFVLCFTFKSGWNEMCSFERVPSCVYCTFLFSCFNTSTPGIIEHYMDNLRSWSWWRSVNLCHVQLTCDSHRLWLCDYVTMCGAAD